MGVKEIFDRMTRYLDPIFGMELYNEDVVASCLVACGVLDILLFSSTFATSPGGILLLAYYL
jgi:hypothetical protein